MSLPGYWMHVSQPNWYRGMDDRGKLPPRMEGRDDGMDDDERYAHFCGASQWPVASATAMFVGIS